mmetsp:Transcript_24715/g.20782  ORF Transcript_24715/g.20782 Transcript_24715/m.20782 type:complete len:110 (+) Transcript_24715:273-602(+)
MIVDSLCATTKVVLFLRDSSASCISLSVTESKLEVASSSTMMDGLRSRHLAMLTLCFSPPDNLKPRSPTLVSSPSACFETKSVSLACSSANITLSYTSIFEYSSSVSLI